MTSLYFLAGGVYHELYEIVKGLASELHAFLKVEKGLQEMTFLGKL